MTILGKHSSLFWVGVIISVIVISSPLIQASGEPEASSPHPNDLAIKQLLNAAKDPNEAVMFVVGNRLPSNGVIGNFDQWKSGPINKNDYIRCGSITKTIVTYALIEATQINLNTKLSNLGYPNNVYPGSTSITVRDILNHVSGIQEFTCFLGWNETTGTYIPSEYGGRVDIDLGWKQKQLDFNPGSYFSYSNTGFDLAGELAEQLTGTNASIWIRRIFQSQAPTLHIDRGNLSASSFPETPTYAAFNYPPDLPRYAGSLISKPYDLIKGLNLIVNDQQTFGLMQDWNYPETALWNGGNHACIYYIGGDKYGLGIQYYDLGGNGDYAVGHEGDIGPRTVVAYQPSTDRIFMLHSTSFKTNDIFISLYKQLIHLYNNDENCNDQQ